MEIELSVMQQQCLRQRLATQELLAEAVAAWEHEHNQQKAKIRWQFTTADARIKLRRLYPSINI